MYAYDDITETCSPRSALQRACSYVYDALVLPYLAQTYTTTTTLIVITGAFQRTSTPTTATVHRNRHNRISSKKHGIYSFGSTQSAACGLQSAVSLHTYDASTTTCDNLTAPTPTTTNTTAIINIVPANQSPPTTHSLDYYYGYRYYNPELGRWPSRDPIGELGFLRTNSQWNSERDANLIVTLRRELSELAVWNSEISMQVEQALARAGIDIWATPPLEPSYLFARGDPIDLYDVLGLDDSSSDEKCCDIEAEKDLIKKLMQTLNDEFADNPALGTKLAKVLKSLGKLAGTVTSCIAVNESCGNFASDPDAVTCAMCCNALGSAIGGLPGVAFEKVCMGLCAELAMP